MKKSFEIKKNYNVSQQYMIYDQSESGNGVNGRCAFHCKEELKKVKV